MHFYNQNSKISSSFRYHFVKYMLCHMVDNKKVPLHWYHNLYELHPRYFVRLALDLKMDCKENIEVTRKISVMVPHDHMLKSSWYYLIKSSAYWKNNHVFIYKNPILAKLNSILNACFRHGGIIVILYYSN